MNKTWLVATFTYRRRIRSGSFLLLTLGLPLLMILAGAVPSVLDNEAQGLPPLGMVDESGRLLVPATILFNGNTLSITKFEEEATARSALERAQIGAYLVVPATYFTGTAPVLYMPAGEATDMRATRLRGPFAAALRVAMIPDGPPWLLDRLADPSDIAYFDTTSGVAITSRVGRVSYFLVPTLLALIFGLIVFTTANQLGSAIVREKDQRAMEIVITSLPPSQLVMGKVLGIALLNFTQITIWLVGGAVALLLAFSGTVDPQQLSIPWRAVSWSIILGLPAYMLYAIIAAGLGIIAGDTQQAQQLAGVLGFLGLAPLWLLGVIVGEPNGTIAQLLTYFPLTSPMVGPLRMAFGTVPTWQLAFALAIILLSVIGSTWFVTRIFHAALLLYGQALRPHAIWQALRTSQA